MVLLHQGGSAVDQRDSDAVTSRGLSPEDYQRMSETEKDVEIMRAIIRLQTKIRTILYLTEAEKAGKERIRDQGPREGKNEKERE
jgi:hypothetical protein